MSVRYLSPAGEIGVAQTPYREHVDLSASPKVLFLGNGYVDSIPTLEHLAEALAPLAPSIVAELRAKGTSMSEAARPLDATALDHIAASVDAVITAYGHCGSCTSATTRDGVALARRGRAVVVLVTEKFAGEARMIARAAGIEELPIVSLPHPMAGLDDADRRAAVVAVAGEVVDALAGARHVATASAR